jgi:hypothetical protein
VPLPFVAPLPAAAAVKLGLKVGLSGIASKYAGHVAEILFQGFPWLLRQHGTDNILACFNTEPEPRVYSSMHTWPWATSIFAYRASFFRQFFRSLRPFPDDEPGIRNIFGENKLRELKCQRLLDYNPREHVGELPDWAGRGGLRPIR